MNSLTFKASLQEFLSTPERPAESEVKLQVEFLLESFGELEEALPPEPPISMFNDVIQRARNGEIESVARRDLVKVCSWYFTDILKLNDADMITNEIMRYAKNRGSSSLYKHLLLGVLGSLDSQSAALANVLNPIESNLSLVGRRWSERVNQYGLLQKPYGNMLAKNILALRGQSARSNLVEASGLKIFRANGLGVYVFVQLSKELFEALNSSEDIAVKVRIFKVWREYSCDDNGLRYAGRYSAQAAQVLLRPWSAIQPPDELKNDIIDVLLESFGDPRTHKPRWAGIAEEDINTVRRWLAADSFDLFIRAISENALDSQWRYRKAFWSWYLENDLVLDVWVVCGTLASASLKRIDRQLLSARRLRYAELKGANSSQSVLIMRIKNLTIAEWSHDGSVRFWLGQNQQKPALFEADYSGSELRTGSDKDIAHRGVWFPRVADYIEQQTGVARPRFDTNQ